MKFTSIQIIRFFQIYFAQRFLRTSSLVFLAALGATLSLCGCCGPIGPGCHTGHCYDCDGTAGRPIPYAPFQNIKRQLICGGGGCGEVYIGEWISTPPDCEDPCCHDQFVGGAVRSRPFCWEPGSLLNLQRFSGRFEDGESGCESGCQSCDSGSWSDASYLEHEYDPGYGAEGIIETPHQSRAHSGCPSCSGHRSASVKSPVPHYAQANQPNSRPRATETYTVQTPKSQRVLATRTPPNMSRPSDSAPSSTAAPRTGASRNRVAEYSDYQTDRIRR
jgi:hypothetical protein